MNKAREVLHFQKYLIKFWDQYALKKADPEMFSIWVNDIFAKKEALPDIYGLMHSQKCGYQSDYVIYHYQESSGVPMVSRTRGQSQLGRPSPFLAA